jgi:hypothetical protein
VAGLLAFLGAAALVIMTPGPGKDGHDGAALPFGLKG